MRALRSHCRPTAHGCNGRRRARRLARKRGRGRPQRLLRRARRRRGDGGGGIGGGGEGGGDAGGGDEAGHCHSAFRRSSAWPYTQQHGHHHEPCEHHQHQSPAAPAARTGTCKLRPTRAAGAAGAVGLAPAASCPAAMLQGARARGGDERRSAAVRARFHRVRARHPGVRACVLSRWTIGLSLHVGPVFSAPAGYFFMPRSRFHRAARRFRPLRRCPWRTRRRNRLRTSPPNSCRAHPRTSPR